MSFLPPKSCPALLAALTLASASPAARAVEAPSGNCGGALYAGKPFAPRLKQSQQRLESTCKQRKALSERLHRAAPDCSDQQVDSYLGKLDSRSETFCYRGLKSMRETTQLCTDYEAGVTSSKAGLATAVSSTETQAGAFTGRAKALTNASGQMSTVAGSAGALEKRINRWMPPANDKQAGTTDPEIQKLMEAFRAHAKATPAYQKASCQQLQTGMDQLAFLTQQNIMPHLRVMQGGVADINKAASATAASTSSAASSDNQQAAKLLEANDGLTPAERAEKRSLPLNQDQPQTRPPGGQASAINQAPRPAPAAPAATSYDWSARARAEAIQKQSEILGTEDGRFQ